MKSNMEYFCGGWNRIFKWEYLCLKAYDSCVTRPSLIVAEFGTTTSTLIQTVNIQKNTAIYSFT